MKIAVVSDSKTEHLSQCLGLRQLLKEYKNNKDVFILNKDLISLPGFLEHLLTIVSEKIYLFFLRLVNPNLVDLNFDLVICSGSRTAIPALLLAKSSKAKIIYIGSPKFRIMKKFDGIISTKKDISSVYRVISTKLIPNESKPYEKKAEPSKKTLVLIGGDGSGYDYGESDWYRLAFEFKNINTTFLNSRRTPDFAWQNLKENSGKNHEHLEIESTNRSEFTNALDQHSHIFVTADSAGVITDIVTRGYFVNVIEMRGPIKMQHHQEILQSFEKKGLLKILKLNQLHHSENKYTNNVKDFVVTERDALKSRILELL